MVYGDAVRLRENTGGDLHLDVREVHASQHSHHAVPGLVGLKANRSLGQVCALTPFRCARHPTTATLGGKSRRSLHRRQLEHWTLRRSGRQQVVPEVTTSATRVRTPCVLTRSPRPSSRTRWSRKQAAEVLAHLG